MASRTITLAINGMHCASCQAAIETALGDLPGISKVAVNASAGKGQVSYDPSRIGVAEMARAVAEVGYEIGEEELTLKVTGMSCASCASKVETAVGTLEGVAGVVVNVPAELAKVRYYANLVNPSEIRGAIRELGYQVEDRAEGQAALDRERDYQSRREIKIQTGSILKFISQGKRIQYSRFPIDYGKSKNPFTYPAFHIHPLFPSRSGMSAHTELPGIMVNEHYHSKVDIETAVQRLNRVFQNVAGLET